MRVGVLLVLLCPLVHYVIVFSSLAGGSSGRLLAATLLLLVAQMPLLPLFLFLYLYLLVMAFAGKVMARAVVCLFAVPFVGDYLAAGPAEICVGWSRHWVACQLWFLS